MNARPRFHIVGRDEPVSPYRSAADEQQDFDRIRKNIQRRRDDRYAMIVWLGLFAASFVFWSVLIAWVAAKEIGL